MTESEVWKKGISFLKKAGFEIHCGSPSGASSYMFKNCNLIDNGTLDAPDIIFSKDSVIFFCECKPTFRELFIKNKHNESDVDKLNRLVSAATLGHYNVQLANNYGINIHSGTMFRSCICFHGNIALGSMGHVCLIVEATKAELIY